MPCSGLAAGTGASTACSAAGKAAGRSGAVEVGRVGAGGARAPPLAGGARPARPHRSTGATVRAEQRPPRAAPAPVPARWRCVKGKTPGWVGRVVRSRPRGAASSLVPSRWQPLGRELRPRVSRETGVLACGSRSPLAELARFGGACCCLRPRGHSALPYRGCGTTPLPFCRPLHRRGSSGPPRFEVVPAGGRPAPPDTQVCGGRSPSSALAAALRRAAGAPARRWGWRPTDAAASRRHWAEREEAGGGESAREPGGFCRGRRCFREQLCGVRAAPARGQHRGRPRRGSPRQPQLQPPASEACAGTAGGDLAGGSRCRALSSSATSAFPAPALAHPTAPGPPNPGGVPPPLPSAGPRLFSGSPKLQPAAGPAPTPVRGLLVPRKADTASRLWRRIPLPLLRRGETRVHRPGLEKPHLALLFGAELLRGHGGEGGALKGASGGREVCVWGAAVGIPVPTAATTSPPPPFRLPPPALEEISSVHLNTGLVPPPGGEGSAVRGRRLIPLRPPGRAGGAASPRGALPGMAPPGEAPAPPPPAAGSGAVHLTPEGEVAAAERPARRPSPPRRDFPAGALLFPPAALRQRCHALPGAQLLNNLAVAAAALPCRLVTSSRPPPSIIQGQPGNCLEPGAGTRAAVGPYLRPCRAARSQLPGGSGTGPRGGSPRRTGKVAVASPRPGEVAGGLPPSLVAPRGSRCGRRCCSLEAFSPAAGYSVAAQLAGAGGPCQRGSQDWQPLPRGSRGRAGAEAGPGAHHLAATGGWAVRRPARRDGGPGSSADCLCPPQVGAVQRDPRAELVRRSGRAGAVEAELFAFSGGAFSGGGRGAASRSAGHSPGFAGLSRPGDTLWGPWRAEGDPVPGGGPGRRSLKRSLFLFP
ncbi:basic proline-rich protein-like [Pezoporus flaviventris]|uniref:basic proline-rich protein-like n=1 Tax=Pezoporus flaviventris TaxID=889875 RepID=UPI002AB109A7|nr:basic proline-rich protein-like [Pezoporus flaviventris]